MKIKGVITGDIVSSSSIQLEWREKLLLTMQEIAEDLKEVSDLQIEFFRGDSFQLLVEQPEKTLLVAILFRAGLVSRTPQESKRRWDARVSIGIGEVSFLSDNILVSDGEAFHFSGREMDDIKKKRLTLRTRWEHINEELSVSTAFADDIISGWTQAQAEVIYLVLLHDITQKEIASRIDKSPQTISKLLGTAKENLIKKYLERYQKLILKEINK
ncbi:hypothetical protein HQ45_07085 [Porphyromonas crevioricanis]|uniref:RNA polymerase sigma factor, sigma-70 family n=2 Tax=Porphyromonas crevioricanis TaxID=393921 RepID=A0A0A2FRI6_9PORP|nr:MarR family transcriptional regulator [Porphyromonas crevioricanis]KGN89734.1 hypothetical protein HQ45_07085 [Porphyromonas crevioricanis]KGN93731.1 hypothetical protein HQ38_08070 [Porphyromonas crevioricanis]SJZ76316.1 hypothetical protein SAMN02745203_00773 [Porphyromonas crevioricanis]SQH72315.1 RNA polymerase sigma factor, sigma-70 family [Porphyromonas crevioricanis]GAD04449.1 hypothetical protein PORCRE_133 [Porphyromonas crevioricanis JCM 15906]